jgi:hypothetical protein
MSIDTFIKENPRFAKREPKVAIETEQDKLEDFDNIETVKEDIIKIFRSIVKNEEEYIYFMKTIASFLIQNNIEEKAYFWLGQGRNGKGRKVTVRNYSLQFCYQK